MIAWSAAVTLLLSAVNIAFAIYVFRRISL